MKYILDLMAFIHQVQLQDYRKSNTSSFYANTHQNRVVENGLKTLSGKLYEVGIASTKYDMIGHSMGGILSRLYNQEIDNKHTNKLITLNTPHFGSKLGDYFIELEAAQAMDSYVADWFGEKFDKAKAEVFADDASRRRPCHPKRPYSGTGLSCRQDEWHPRVCRRYGDRLG